MKKFLFSLILLLTLFLFLPKNTFAQGSHGCLFILSYCAPDNGASCESGFAPNAQACNNLTGRGGTACEDASPKCLPEDDPRTLNLTNLTPEQDPTCSLGNSTGIDTAIGCIPIGDPEAFVGFILKWGIGVGGGVAFLLIIFAGFQIMTASGSPDRLKAGQELMTSAIAGLVLIILSVFILQVIGVGILNIPGFGN